MADQVSSSSFFTYDVFFSFNPFHTSNGFAANVSQAFQRRGIKAFIESRDEITPVIFNAIVESRSSVILLSKNYASSSRCLEELAYILDNFHHATSFVFPFFYHVDPSDVRDMRGAYGEALARHEENLKDNNQDKLLKWKNALCQVANLSAFHLQHGVGCDESGFITKIVKEVSRKHYYAPLANEDHLVGLDDPLEELCSLMDMKSDSVLKIGIFGMTCVGKTTLARAVYNRIAHQFEGDCFLDVKGSGLVCLQNRLLFDIVGEDIQIESADRGASLIKYWLQQKKVLLILDDVDTLEQLEALVGGQDWFGSGSRIIVTTSDSHLLAYQGFQITYNVKFLNDKYAYDLFIHNAFGQGEVEPMYAEVLHPIFAYADGLPFGLETVGSALYGKSVDEWRYAFYGLKSHTHNDIYKIQRRSFDNLSEDEQTVFLDIACCFNGYKLTELNRILCAHYGRKIKHLVDGLIVKSLLSISLDGKVRVHELIEDMGKEIVRQESPDPGKHSRLWSHDDILYILKTNKGTDKIQIIHLDPPLIGDEAIEWDGEAFKKMENLKTLVIKKCHFSNAPKHLPSSLRVLQWWNYPSQKLPCDFDSKQLVILWMSQDKGVALALLTELFMTYQIICKTCKRAARVMLQASVRVLQAEVTWRLVGLVSSVVGLLCYALSPSFNQLIGGWNSFKIVLYAMFSLIIGATILFGKKSSLSVRYVEYKTYMKFAVLMIVSVYSFYYDNAVAGKPELLSLVSNAALALMSLSLSRLVKLGFEIGIFSYFLGCLVIQLWTIDGKLILVAIIFGCPLFIMQSSLDSEPEVCNGSQVINSDSQTVLTNGGQDIHPNSQTVLTNGGQDIHSSSNVTP
ncbi:hypothetical protein RYX36_000050 [Vicia faba]